MPEMVLLKWSNLKRFYPVSLPSVSEVLVYDVTVEEPTGGAMSQSDYYANDPINYINNPN